MESAGHGISYGTHHCQAGKATAGVIGNKVNPESTRYPDRLSDLLFVLAWDTALQRGERRLTGSRLN
ncbi:hypothetical protein GCM10022394_03840 [Zobellella aerophila]|uniref:Uncharacterized protein n=1 Tax=Zobellella aerophila TaxID=870480 RepID=A0ABP6V3T7_9GAMM